MAIEYSQKALEIRKLISPKMIITSIGIYEDMPLYFKLNNYEEGFKFQEYVNQIDPPRISTTRYTRAKYWFDSDSLKYLTR
ncbi:MAG: hypothetical protein IPJ74_08650 [Saprospiraceae bacterium]|nr:hypothetical protein [Saprospiraceae bacterium]